MKKYCKKLSKSLSMLFLSAVIVGVVPTITHAEKVYRYFNGTDHFYTTNWDELGSGRNGFNYEGVAFDAVDHAYSVYRFYNGTDHFYTMDKNEGLNAGYKYEGIAFHSWFHNVPGHLTPVYRYYNGVEHFYTTNWGELGDGKHGYKYEGMAFYE